MISKKVHVVNSIHEVEGSISMKLQWSELNDPRKGD
jgi:hypothetical protein